MLGTHWLGTVYQACKPLWWKDIVLDFLPSISLQDTYAPIPQLSKSQLLNPWEYHINEISKKILLLALVLSSVLCIFSLLRFCLIHWSSYICWLLCNVVLQTLQNCCSHWSNLSISAKLVKQQRRTAPQKTQLIKFCSRISDFAFSLLLELNYL